MDPAKRAAATPGPLSLRPPTAAAARQPSPKPGASRAEDPPAAVATRLAAAQRELLTKRLFKVPRHRICLRRSKYMVIRTASRELRWRHVKEDREASVVWLDRWENGDLMNLAPPRKVRGAAAAAATRAATSRPRTCPLLLNTRTHAHTRTHTHTHTHTRTRTPPPCAGRRLATSRACPRWAQSARLGAR
jgi:hypothetical protein